MQVLDEKRQFFCNILLQDVLQVTTNGFGDEER